MIELQHEKHGLIIVDLRADTVTYNGITADNFNLKFQTEITNLLIINASSNLINEK